MGYQAAFRDIVLKPLREDAAIHHEVHAYLVAYQQSRTEIASLCMSAHNVEPAYARRMVALLVDGLRYGARSGAKQKRPRP